MKNRSGRVIRVWKSVDCRHELVDSERLSDRVAAGYYFLMSKATTKKRQYCVAPLSVDVYGPFVSSAVARLVQTSAHAFGLVSAEADMLPVASREIAEHVSVLPDQSTARSAERSVAVRRNDSVVQLTGRH